jgi:aspartyl-tRNA(Asn)/glutamyl-tRNA(Gln) amidotransferase subunit C
MSKVELTDKELDKLFALARLRFEDREKLKKQIGEVLSFVSTLETVDTSGADETNDVTGLSNVFYKGDNSRNLTKTEALSGARVHTNDHFVVPGVFSDNDA